MRIDWGTLAGLLLAFGGIAAGLTLEGGSLYEILQPTAALIVFGGTFGATLVAEPLPVVWGACRQLTVVFAEPRYQLQTAIEEIISLANQARRHGIVIFGQEDPGHRRSVSAQSDVIGGGRNRPQRFAGHTRKRN